MIDIKDINNTDRYTIELSGFDLKLILDSLDKERYNRLSKTPWIDRSTHEIYGMPPQYGYDQNDKKVRQVDSVINYIKNQI